MAHARKRKESHVSLSYMVKQGILITPVLGEVLTNLAPLRMKHSASVPAYHKGKPTWLSLLSFACAAHIRLTYAVQGEKY